MFRIPYWLTASNCFKAFADSGATGIKIIGQENDTDSRLYMTDSFVIHGILILIKGDIWI